MILLVATGDIENLRFLLPEVGYTFSGENPSSNPLKVIISLETT